ncbi:unnamed protein product [Hydatigera taeniaeformis]|uniref:Expressed conserved protein n=1 Tax=Hydatigena taeniaeformis TaxID=6205 RepID=A0A0R3WLJ2_HYDTA|nr:unnamed protein product [Hydatigera taeniaeformis]
MNSKIIHLLTALLTAFLLFLAVGYNGWICNGNVFTGDCRHMEYMRIVGGLLLTSGILICLAALIIIVALIRCADWIDFVVVFVVILSTIFSAAGVFYYYNNTHTWSPFIASIAMTISFVLTAFLLIDVISQRVKST